MADPQIPAARRRYLEDGYFLRPEPLFPPELVRGAIAGMDALRAGKYATGVPPRSSYWNPGDDPGKLCKIEMPQIADPRILDLVRHPALGALAAELTGAAMVQVWWVQLLYKPPSAPEHATRIGWHQDRHYWQAWEEGSELFTAWIALSDVDGDSGPMRFVRGSHRWGLLGGSDFYGQDHAAQRAAFALPAGARWEEAPAHLPAGGVSFHHCLTLHGSGPNRTGRARRSFALHLRTERSRPAGGLRKGLTEFIDNPAWCPVIHGAGPPADSGPAAAALRPAGSAALPSSETGPRPPRK